MAPLWGIKITGGDSMHVKMELMPVAGSVMYSLYPC